MVWWMSKLRTTQIFLFRVCFRIKFFYQETYINDFGLEKIFGNVIEELTKLATDGIVIDSQTYTVFFVCGLYLGKRKPRNAISADNKDPNTCLGYQRSLTALKYCRYCQMGKYKAQYAVTENPATRQTE